MNSAHFLHGRRTMRVITAVVVAVMIASVATMLIIIGPAPPRTITMAAGAEGTVQQEFAESYRALLAVHGVELRLVSTKGSADSLQRLNDPKSGVSVAFLQGGVTTARESPKLVSLGTVFYEPVWVFYRGKPPRRSKEMFNGKRVSVGPLGSGTRHLAIDLIAALGMDPLEMDIRSMLMPDAAEAMLKGDLDVAFMVAAWETPAVRQLLTSDRISVLPFPRADAHIAQRPYLSKLVVPQGVADLAKNIPATDLVLFAPKASLVVRSDLHRALQYLLLDAASQVHGTPGIFQKAGQFPASEPIDLPLSEEAREFFHTGAPFLQRYLPFWLAVFVGRLLLILIPVIGVVIPLFRFIPASYGYIVRRRVFILYGELKFLEAELEARKSDEPVKDLLERLGRLESRANQLRVPIMFSHFLYNLRSHIDLVRARLMQRMPEGSR
ncbi:MAG: TAXI family TRAP transporter solute-binding subunit [Burkholderiales bacterium]|jgi:TRAP-type uncharacterized transport system substrate-binding protein